ncbi:MAG: metallophosphoesterase [Candidatus Korobacteraceae bacterium]
MSFRYLILLTLLLLNLFAVALMWRSVAAWARSRRLRVGLMAGIMVAVCLLNLPLFFFFLRGTDAFILSLPTSILKPVFYPATAWIVTLMVVFVVGAPIAILVALVKGVRKLLSPRSAGAPQPVLATAGPGFSRRQFLAGSTGLVVPALFSVSAYATYRGLDDLEVSRELTIPVRNLPRSLDGMTIVQLTDLHVGPYMREVELQHLVSVVNGLNPDVVVLTGDMIDRHLSALPDAVRGLTGFRPTLGSFAVLGNHDVSADRYSYTRQYRGGVEIAKGLASVGIRTLRNENIYLGTGQDRLALMGLDWMRNPGTGGFYRYDESGTRSVLTRLTAELASETPKVLLAHHPDTFSEVPPFDIALTLAGHTHGAGQIVLGYVDGQPIGLASFRFKYLSGLYQEKGCSLYVNRGVGYLGVPIRINCPPEISRFRLVRATSAS